MNFIRKGALRAFPAAALLAAVTVPAFAQSVTRLTPPSRLFSFGAPGGPITARFLPGQRFDLQATVETGGAAITSFQFFVDGNPVIGNGAGQVPPAAAGTLDANASASLTDTVVSARAYSNFTPGVHLFSVRAELAGGGVAAAQGNFEVVRISQNGRRAKNIIVMIGDGLGIAHRTAARLILNNVQQGKTTGLLAMDTFPVTGLVATHSLNSIVTDSSPGSSCYSSGNKANNNQHGVFPDDTTAIFDNPRVELIGEYLSRTQGKSLGIVTTSDIFDATPAAWASHTQARGAGTGIVDQYLLEGVSKMGLRVLLGGGRRWFTPGNTPASPSRSFSSRASSSDYVLPADLATGWGVPAGTLNPNEDVIAQFQAAGFTYAPTRAAMDAAPNAPILGLFATGNMNVALDKLAKRRNAPVGNLGGINPVTGNFVVDDFLFPDQPLLEEMTDKALAVLNTNQRGFVLMVEAASIDKQAHNMDTERWIFDTVEFDRATARAQAFARQNPDTIVIVTADHECAGVNIIGASRVTNAELQTRAASGGGAAQLRNGVVGTYEAAGFPVYTKNADGYPQTPDVDRKMLIGYAANADRNEDWLTNPLPLYDNQSLLNNAVSPGSTLPSGPLARDTAGAFLVTGQIADPVAAHTASDIPLSAFGRGAMLFGGFQDNTDVFFKLMQIVLGGAL